MDDSFDLGRQGARCHNNPFNIDTVLVFCRCPRSGDPPEGSAALDARKSKYDLWKAARGFANHEDRVTMFLRGGYSFEFSKVYAAAPDMLDVLVQLRQVHDDHLPWEDEKRLISEAIHLALPHDVAKDVLDDE